MRWWPGWVRRRRVSWCVFSGVVGMLADRLPGVPAGVVVFRAGTRLRVGRIAGTITLGPVARLGGGQDGAGQRVAGWRSIVQHVPAGGRLDPGPRLVAYLAGAGIGVYGDDGGLLPGAEAVLAGEVEWLTGRGVDAGTARAWMGVDDGVAWGGQVRPGSAAAQGSRAGVSGPRVADEGSPRGWHGDADDWPEPDAPQDDGSDAMELDDGPGGMELGGGSGDRGSAAGQSPAPRSPTARAKLPAAAGPASAGCGGGPHAGPGGPHAGPAGPG